MTFIQWPWHWVSVRRLVAPLRFSNQMYADTSQLKEIDRNGKVERQIRFSVLGGMTLLVWILDGLWVPLIWLPIYFGSLYLSSLLVQAAPTRISWSGLTGLGLVLFLDSALYFFMAGYLWAHDSTLYATLALIMIAGYMLNATTEHCEDPLLVLVDIAASGLAVIGMAIASFLLEGNAGSLILSVATILLWAYFSRSVLNTMLMRRRLRDTQLRLVETKKMEAIGHLTGGLAHDYNNLLAAVIGNLELLQTVADPQEKDTLAQAARRSALTAADLTSQVMAVARRAHIQPEVIPVSTVFQRLWPWLRRQLPLSVSLTMEADPPDLTVFADRTQLEKVVLELADNASNAFDGSGHFTILAKAVTRDEIPPLQGGMIPETRDYVALSVIDTGCGMDARTLEKATEPFFSTRLSGTASGLGLAVARGIAEQLGGGIQLESREKAGTKVTLYLPRHPIATPHAVHLASNTA